MKLPNLPLSLRFYGDPVLQASAARIPEVTPEIRSFARDMIRLMHEAHGIGLAAPQVGGSVRLFVLDIEGTEVRDWAFVNPVLTPIPGDRQVGAEGCLSIPGVPVEVERPSRVSVQATVFQPLDGSSLPRTVQLTAEGLLARALQHEQDHLDGILIFDRATPLERQKALLLWEKVKAELQKTDPGFPPS